MDVHSILASFVVQLEGLGDQFEDEHVFRDLHLKIMDYIESKNDIAAKLGVIKGYLFEIKTILDDTNTSAEEALDKLEQYSKNLGERIKSEKCFEIEKNFIKTLQKYLKNKGKLLFNYKRIDGAPRTNFELYYRLI